jgi:hypothetical protein
MFTLKIKKRGERFTQRGGRGSGARARRAAARAAKAGRPPPPPRAATPRAATPPPRQQTPKQQRKAAASKKAKAERAKTARAAGLAKQKEYQQMKQSGVNPQQIRDKKTANRTARQAAFSKQKADKKAATQKRVKDKLDADKRKKAPAAKRQGSSPGFFSSMGSALSGLGQMGMAALSGLAALAGMAAQLAGALLGLLATAAKALFDIIGGLLSSIFDSMGGYTNAFKDKDGKPLPCKEQCEKIIANESISAINAEKRSLFEEIIRESFVTNKGSTLNEDEKIRMCAILSKSGDDPKSCNPARITNLINEGNKMNSHNFYIFLTLWITAGYKCSKCECKEYQGKDCPNKSPPP